MGEVRNLDSAPSLRRARERAWHDQIDVPAQRQAPRVARHWVMRTIADLGVTGTPNQFAELLTAEVVSNAVVHGPADGSIRVSLTLDDAVLRIAVTDAGGGRPVVRHTPPTAPDGRGMALVEALAGAWGTVPEPVGKTVWFELAIDD